jgi:hypothetical protein
MLKDGLLRLTAISISAIKTPFLLVVSRLTELRRTLQVETAQTVIRA